MKKLLLVLLTVSSSLGFSQGTWTPRTSFPDSAYFQGISGFSIGNYGYVGLGSAQNIAISFDYFWQFDASADTWTRKASFPGAARVSPASFVIGGKAYIVTGSVKNGGACVNECWEYDTATDAWTQKANFPGSARVYAVGFAIDSLGYVGTGAYELHDFCKDFYAYHPSTDSWTRVADFGGIARDAANGFGVNGKGYVCFGQDSTLTTHDDIWEYDPVLNTWSPKTNCPGPGLVVAIGFSICDNIYVGSGDTTANVLSDDFSRFWKYNTISDSWTQETNAPYPSRFQGAAFAIADTGYYGLGADSDVRVHTIFDKFYAGDSCANNIITGDRDIADVSGIAIYPNPTNSRLSIKFNEQPIGLVNLSIMDITGREVINSQFTIYNSQFSVDVSSLSSGMYFISLTDKQGAFRVMQKFVKD